MKRLFAIAILAVSTLFASAPARAIDAGTALVMQSSAGMFNNILRMSNQRRQPCYRPNVVINGRCMPPHMARRGVYPSTYLPPDIPGSSGYTGRGYSRSEFASERRGEPHCTIKGAVFVPQIGGCVRSVRDVAELQRIVPDLAVDPECRGKPPGFRFDRPVTGARGEVGVDHRVCGSRPAQ